MNNHTKWDKGDNNGVESRFICAAMCNTEYRIMQITIKQQRDTNVVTLCFQFCKKSDVHEFKNLNEYAKKLYLPCIYIEQSKIYKDGVRETHNTKRWLINNVLKLHLFVNVFSKKLPWYKRKNMKII